MLSLGPRKRHELFLDRGFFPIELPPPFVSDSLAQHRATIVAQLPSKLEGYHTQFEPYGFPRFDGNRRRLAIVNPIPYFVASKLIADNWNEIRRHLNDQRSPCSSQSLTLRGQEPS
jgi:hypothetical protein